MEIKTHQWDVPKNKRLSETDSILFEKLYLNGVRRKEIAKILGISESGIKKRIERKKLAYRHFEFTEKMIDEMVEYWRNKLSINQIAIKMDLDKSQIQYQLKKLYLVD